jgi:hypothetical protein
MSTMPLRLVTLSAVDTNRPEDSRNFFGSEQLSNSDGYVAAIRQEGRSLYSLGIECAGRPLPSGAVAAEIGDIGRRLSEAKEQVEAEYQAAEKLAEIEAHRQDLQDRLAEAQAALTQCQDRAAQLVDKHQDATKEYEVSVLQEKTIASLEGALARARTPNSVWAELASLIEKRVRKEASVIRSEIRARWDEARTWLLLALSGEDLPAAAKGQNLLRRANTALRVHEWCASATEAQKAFFGSAVGRLDVLISDLCHLPEYRRPRSPQENYTAPVMRGF